MYSTPQCWPSSPARSRLHLSCVATTTVLHSHLAQLAAGSMDQRPAKTSKELANAVYDDWKRKAGRCPGAL